MKKKLVVALISAADRKSSYGNIYARRMRKQQRIQQQRKQHSNKQRKCIFRI